MANAFTLMNSTMATACADYLTDATHYVYYEAATKKVWHDLRTGYTSMDLILGPTEITTLTGPPEQMTLYQRPTGYLEVVIVLDYNAGVRFFASLDNGATW